MLGILFGDGSMSKVRSSLRIPIAGHKQHDREYMKGRVRPMFEQLFGVSLRVLFVKDENTMMLYRALDGLRRPFTNGECHLAARSCQNITPNVDLDEVS